MVTLGTLVACGGDGEGGSAERITAAELQAQPVLDADDYLALAPYAGADRANGARLAQACRGCHRLAAGAGHGTGPNLHGIFGRIAGTRQGFDYSKAMREVEFVWTPRALDAWLRSPATFLPGTRMSFAGIADAGDRADLVAWLLAAAGDTEPTAEAVE